MQGLIFDIKRFAVHDGPGIRTTVFFKGCPLSCHWCHNPESRKCYPEHVDNRERIGNMVFQNRQSVGKYLAADALMHEIEKDRVFYETSGGGITCSGGEPLMQADFLLELLHLCRRHDLHTAIDTTGYAQPATIRKLIPVTDLFLYDLKILNDETHKKRTGVSNRLILKNLDTILGKGIRTIIRIPVVPGINDDTESMQSLAGYISERRGTSLEEVHLLPYHNMARSKYTRFNMGEHDGFREPSANVMRKISNLFQQKNLLVKIGG